MSQPGRTRQPIAAHLPPDRARVANEGVRRVHIWLAQQAQVTLSALLDALLPFILRHAADKVLVLHLCTGGVAQTAHVRVQPLERQEELVRAGRVCEASAKKVAGGTVASRRTGRTWSVPSSE